MRLLACFAPPEVLGNLRGWCLLALCASIVSLSGCHHVKQDRINNGAQKVFGLAKDIEAALTDDSDSKRSFQELPVAYQQELKPLLKGQWEQGCDGKCMSSLFPALDYVCFFSFQQTANPELPDVLKTTFSHLKASGLASEKQAKNVRKCLIKFRRFDEAREFSVAERLDEEEIPPVIIPASLPPIRRVIEYAADGHSLSVVQAKPLGKTAVVMLASPTCGASQEAVKEIDSDATLHESLLPKLTIISNPNGTIEAAAFAEWNRQHPQFRLAQAFSAEDWPEITDWENFPAFYFIAKGKAVAYTWGWGPHALDNFKSELRKLETNSGE